MKKNLLDSLEKQYEIYGIRPATFDFICRDAISRVVPNRTIDINYQYYWKIKDYLNNHIMYEIKNGNEEYKMFLAISTTNIVKRYFTLKKINVDSKYIDSKYKNIAPENRLERYYEDISDSIINDLMQEYDYQNSLEKQYIKELNKKFNK